MNIDEYIEEQERLLVSMEEGLSQHLKSIEFYRNLVTNYEHVDQRIQAIRLASSLEADTEIYRKVVETQRAFVADLKSPVPPVND